MLFIYSIPKFKFVFQKNGAMSEVDAEALDVYFNLTFVRTQLMNGKVPWRGAREKEFELMQI